jgi:Ca2+-binding RTX toxin-like protein
MKWRFRLPLLAASAILASLLGASPASAADCPAVSPSGFNVIDTHSDGKDTVTGTSGADAIYARGGNDTIHGEGGDDLICAGAGSDDAFGGAGDDLIYGEDGNDVQLFGQRGNDTIRGGVGDDGIDGEQGDDIVDGGSGTDRLDFSLLNNTFPPLNNTPRHGIDQKCHGVNVSLSGGTVTGDGQDTIVNHSIEQVIGSPCNDVISGTSGNDTLYGSPGADELYGRDGSDLLVPNTTFTGNLIFGIGIDGNDLVFGGAGDDTVDYSGAMGVPGEDSVVDVNLATGMVRRDGTGHSDRLLGIEAVYGSFGDDRLVGNAAANLLLGEGPETGVGPPPTSHGNDVLKGAGGNDYLDGVIGDDKLYGGPGAADVVDYGHYGSLQDPRPDRVGVDLRNDKADVVWRNIPSPFRPTGKADTLGSKKLPPTTTVTDSDELTSIEDVAGTPGRDRLRGDGRPNDLLGEGGDDQRIRGRDGSDLLLGGGGYEPLLGGPGNDWCFGGKARGCERSLDPERGHLDVCAAPDRHYRHVKSPKADARLDDLRHLDQERCFRRTGFGELQQLSAALEAMRVHRSPGG